MPRRIEEQPVRPSVLDRLLGLADLPELPVGDLQRLEDLKLSVRRDVQNLLNTRWRILDLPKDSTELECSIVNYGVPDFTGLNLASPAERKTFCQLLRKAIEHHEPRLTRLHVEIVESEVEDGTLRFLITGELLVGIQPLPVTFDSKLETAENRIEISDTR